MGKAKVTLAIDESLVDEIDQYAGEAKSNRSRVVEIVLSEWRKKRLEHEMAEGYKAMSDENLVAAEDGIAAGAEVIK
jgi:metal-responsive CopG/Arc/MetJ family transcriptional regulator